MVSIVIRSYDPSNVFAFLNDFHIKEWTGLKVINSEQEDLLHGLGNELARAKLRGHRVVTVEITLPQSSPFNLGMSVISTLSAPVSFTLFEKTTVITMTKEAFMNENIGKVVGGIIADLSTPVGLQVMLWPCIISQTPSPDMARSTGDCVWTIKGYLRGQIIGGYYN